MKRTLTLAAFAASLGVAPLAPAAFLVEIDVDGATAGNVVTLGPNFAYGTVALTAGPPPTFGPMTASVSVGNPALGLTGGNSIFGGTALSGSDFPNPDTYLYSYTPGVDADNRAFTAGQDLNDDGDETFGLPGGATGTYRVYTTWPSTANISTGNGPANYSLSDGVSTLFTTSLQQDSDSPGGLPGNEWYLLGEVTLTAGTTYTLTQTNTQPFTPGIPGFSPDVFTNGFVSMRASGVLFQLIPEPAAGLLALAGLALAPRRRV